MGWCRILSFNRRVNLVLEFLVCPGGRPRSRSFRATIWVRVSCRLQWHLESRVLGGSLPKGIMVEPPAQIPPWLDLDFRDSRLARGALRRRQCGRVQRPLAWSTGIMRTCALLVAGRAVVRGIGRRGGRGLLSQSLKIGLGVGGAPAKFVLYARRRGTKQCAMKTNIFVARDAKKN